jgi:hypothetical protein
MKSDVSSSGKKLMNESSPCCEIIHRHIFYVCKTWSLALWGERVTEDAEDEGAQVNV